MEQPPSERVQIVVACTKEKGGIGFKGRLPWPHLRGDMRRFKLITTTTTDETKRNAVLMGRKTWESLPASSRPLVGRVNIVLTSKKMQNCDGSVIFLKNIEDAMRYVDEKANRIENVFVIGGSCVYDTFMQDSYVFAWKTMHLTLIDGAFPSDCFFPVKSVLSDENVREISKGEHVVDDASGVEYSFLTLERRRL